MGKVEEVMVYLAAYSSKHFDFTFSVPQLPYRLVHLALMVNDVNCHDYCDRELTWCLFCHFRPPERDSRPLPLGQGLASDSLKIDNHLHVSICTVCMRSISNLYVPAHASSHTPLSCRSHQSMDPSRMDVARAELTSNPEGQLHVDLRSLRHYMY